jgi:peptide-methionine (R)-S-oxide reductase
MPDKVKRTDEEWQQQLSPEAYAITRQKGTEPAFTGKYNKHYEKGMYRCVCCGNSLFSSDAKFDSGTGWPSFWEPVRSDHISTELDRSLGMVRSELKCARCDAHLGHVFDDGPEPTGLRYCINSVSLKLRQKER